MRNNFWYDMFLETLNEKFPKKSQLTEALMDLLSLEREAIYRRLRKDVLFTVYEVATIARAWNISLDSLLNTSEENPAFQLELLRSVNPTDNDFRVMNNFVDSLLSLKQDPNAEYIEACNILPMVLLSGFPQLIKFYTFAWMYRYGGENSSCSFTQTVPSEKVMEWERIHYKNLVNIPHVQFIWDAKIFQYLINEIKYYASIYLITPEEEDLIKQDILAFLDYMEEVSRKGHFPETNNKVNLYISKTNIDTGYACYCSDKIKASKIRTFIMNVTVSRDSRLFNDQRKWLHLKKRAAIQISGADEKQRIDFFRQQRQLVDSLPGAYHKTKELDYMIMY
ncbi:MAG: hypothetical protein LBO74_02475 [Candidatus Symbiothrix sp.]|jgi:hypothetical protein|nr:hypothetical protein [Candidatus Symbiothrix sp.]